MDPLSTAVKKSGADAFVLYASSRDADMRYLTNFTTSDPFVFFKIPGNPGVIIISQMELGRASREASAVVMTRTQAGLPDILKKEKDPYKATAKMIAGQVGKKILVPPNFPVALANALNSEQCTILVDHGTVLPMGKEEQTKSFDENVQKVTQKRWGVHPLIVAHRLKRSRISTKTIDRTGKIFYAQSSPATWLRRR
jgi:Xaa-Pro aminopeptidase